MMNFLLFALVIAVLAAGEIPVDLIAASGSGIDPHVLELNLALAQTNVEVQDAAE